MRRPKILTAVSVLMLLTALGTIVFWGAFFADLDAQRSGEFASRLDVWFGWEMSFPLADAWMALTAILGSVGIWRVRPAGLLFGLVSGGAMVFLGLMDILFFVQHGLYSPVTLEVAVEMAIHVWTVAFGLASISLLWRHRGRLHAC